MDSITTKTQFISILLIVDEDQPSSILASIRMIAFKDSPDIEIRAEQKTGDTLYYQITNSNNTVLARQTAISGLTWNLQTTYPINSFPVFGNKNESIHPVMKVNTPTTSIFVEDIDQKANRYSYERYQFAYG